MKSIVYSLIVLGSFLHADSTSYTRIAWTEVPRSAFKTAEFYNPSRPQKVVEQEQEQVIEEIVEATPVLVEESPIVQVLTKVEIDDSRDKIVKLDSPTWIFAD